MNNKQSKSIRMLFCGDFMAKNVQNIELSEEFSNLLKSCEVKCLNFEAPLPIGNPITLKGAASPFQSLDAPMWCEKNGFNVISLSNNHMGDYGQDALQQTKEAFNSSLLVGAGDWEEAYKVKVLEINNLKIGFLALAQCEFGILNDSWTDKELLGCAWINHNKVNKIIQEAKKELDFVIVITHAGIEYTDFPLPEWRDRYKEFIDCGADAVIGGHPHVPQGWEMYNNKPIFYSLGNFYFDWDSNVSFWNNGLSVVLTINEQRQISFEIINTIKIDNRIEIDNSQRIKNHNLEICKILSEEKLYIKEVNKLCLKLWPQYEGTILIALNSERTNFSIKNVAKYFTRMLQGRKSELRYALNYLRCESHRYVMIRAIKLITKIKI